MTQLARLEALIVEQTATGRSKQACLNFVYWHGENMFSNDDDLNPYLSQEVMSASPIRLRWMLIRRAEELCGSVRQMWATGEDEHATQWMLRIREILGELLNGITDAENPLSQTVADFYVFLLQLATEIEATRNVEQLETLQELLAIELETWRQVLENQGEQQVAQNNGAIAPDIGGAPASGSFSLEI